MGWFSKKKKPEVPAQSAAPRPVVRLERQPSPGPPADYVSPYLPSERWDELLRIVDGKFPLRIDFESGWLIERTTGLRVNVGNKHLLGLGIWSVRVRGDEHYSGRFWPGRVAQLVREPENEYDPNAVAIYVDGRKGGYFNRQMARGLAKALDGGQQLEAVVLAADPPKVIAASPGVMAKLRA